MPQKQISFVQIETGFLCDIGCGDSGRVIRLFARMIEQLGLRTPSTTAVSGAAKRRAECTSLGPGPKHPEPPLANFSLAAIRRAEAFHAVFFATKHHDD